MAPTRNDDLSTQYANLETRTLSVEKSLEELRSNSVEQSQVLAEILARLPPLQSSVRREGIVTPGQHMQNASSVVSTTSSTSIDYNYQVFEVHERSSTNTVSIEPDLDALARVLDINKFTLDHDLKNFRSFTIRFAHLMTGFGISSDVLDELLSGIKVPNHSLDSCMLHVLQQMTLNVKEIIPVMDEIMESQAVNMGPRIYSRLQTLYKRRARYVDIAADNFHNLCFSGGSLVEYNSTYQTQYEQLIASGKLVAQEYNIDRYLSSLGKHGFVDAFRSELGRDTSLRMQYKSGNLRVIMDSVEFFFLIEHKSGEIAISVINSNVANSSKGRPSRDSNYCMLCQTVGHKTRNCKQIICTFCNKKGHAEKSCFKKKRGKKSNKKPEQNSTQTKGHVTCPAVCNEVSPDVSPEDIDAALESTAFLMYNVNESNDFEAIPESTSGVIMIDSGASYSVTGDMKLLNKVRKTNSKSSTRLANGDSIVYTHEGVLNLFPGVDVVTLYSSKMAPDMTLLSLEDLHEVNVTANFKDGFLEYRGQSRPLKRWNRVWIMDTSPDSVVMSSTSGPVVKRISHADVGHASLYRCKDLITDPDTFDCTLCQTANAKLGPKKFSDESFTMSPDTVYADYKVLKQGYLLVMVDSRYRFVDVTFLKSKTKAMDSIKAFVASLDYPVKTFCADFDAPWNSKDGQQTLSTIGLTLSIVPPQRHSVNLAERYIQEIMKMVRSLVHSISRTCSDEKSPMKFIPVMARYISFTINRLYTKTFGTSPYQNRYGKAPDPRLFIPFLQPFVYKSLDETSTLRSKGKIGRFLGFHKSPVHLALLISESNQIVRRALCDIKPISDTAATNRNLETSNIDVKQDSQSWKNFKHYFSRSYKSGLMIEDEDSEDSCIDSDQAGYDEVPEVPEVEANVSDDESHAAGESTVIRKSNRIRSSRKIFDPSVEAEKPQWKTKAVAMAAVLGHKFSRLSEEERKNFSTPLVKEIENVFKYDVIEEVPTNAELPKHAQIINSQFVLETKRGTNGKPKYKARLVARGDQMLPMQKKDRYAPTVVPTLILVLLHMLVNTPTFIAKTLDISAAFLQGEQNINDLYMRSAFPMNKMLLKLQGNLYGLSNAALTWYLKLIDTLFKFGLNISEVDNCLLYTDTRDLFVVIHVDDCFMIGTQAKMEKFICFLQANFSLTMTNIRDYIGINIYQLQDGIFVNQGEYLEKILTKYGFADSKAQSTPMEPGKIRALFKGLNSDIDRIRHFQALTGSLVYLQLTRPDIDFSRLNCSICATNPTEDNWKDIKRIYRYLNSTKHIGLHIKSSPGLYRLEAYVDASYLKDQKSVSGYVVMLNDCVISHKSTRQTVVTTSSCEAEMQALALCIKEVAYIDFVLQDLQMNTTRPIIHVDNKSVIDILYSSNKGSARSKHFIPLSNFCRYYIKRFDVVYVNTKENLADTLTKSLSKSQFECLRKGLLQPMPDELDPTTERII